MFTISTWKARLRVFSNRNQSFHFAFFLNLPLANGEFTWGKLMSTSRHRSGFTLVELLVVIAIIGILVALLLPAIQAAREAARRAECTNKLKQLALAAQNYHDTHQVLPAGKLDRSYNNSNRLPWAVALLPFMELQAVYEMWDHTVDERHGNNNEARRISLSEHLCPSDITSPGDVARPQNSDQANYAISSYVGISGRSNGHHAGGSGRHGTWDGDEYHHLTRSGRSGWRGVFHVVLTRSNRGGDIPVFSNMTFASIQDGTSNTLMFSERHQAQDFNRRATYWASAQWTNSLGTIMPRGHLLQVVPSFHRCQEIAERNHECARGLGSYHPGGLNFALADGAVRFISEDVNAEVISGLASVQGGELVQVP